MHINVLPLPIIIMLGSLPNDPYMTQGGRRSGPDGSPGRKAGVSFYADPIVPRSISRPTWQSLRYNKAMEDEDEFSPHDEQGIRDQIDDEIVDHELMERLDALPIRPSADASI